MDFRVLDGLAQAKLVTSESAGSAGAHADQFSREHLLLLSDDRSPRRAWLRSIYHRTEVWISPWYCKGARIEGRE